MTILLIVNVVIVLGLLGVFSRLLFESRRHLVIYAFILSSYLLPLSDGTTQIP